MRASRFLSLWKSSLSFSRTMQISQMGNNQVNINFDSQMFFPISGKSLLHKSMINFCSNVKESELDKQKS